MSNIPPASVTQSDSATRQKAEIYDAWYETLTTEM